MTKLEKVVRLLQELQMPHLARMATEGGTTADLILQGKLLACSKCLCTFSPSDRHECEYDIGGSG